MVPAQPTASVLEQVEFETRTYQGAQKAEVRVVPRPRDIGASGDVQSLSLNATTTAVTVPPQSTSDSSTSATNGSESTENSQSTGETLDIYYISNSQYFVGLFLPTFLSTLLAVPLRIIDFNYKLYRPFHNLARPSGATASASLFLATTGLSSFFTVQDVLGCTTMALVVLSTVLIPISAEAVHVVMHGDECHAGQGSADNCGFTLGVNPTFAHIVIAILPVMGALLVLAWTRLRRYRTAVPVKPWNMSFMSSFASDPAIQALLSQLDRSAGCLNMKDGMRVFDHWTYTVETPMIRPKAGCRVAILEKSSTHEKDNNTKPSRRDFTTPAPQATAQHAKSRALYSFVLTFAGRILILLALLGVLLLVVVYTQNTDVNGFETFMDSERIGVRIFFPSTGVALTLAWTSFFQGNPYKISRRAPTTTAAGKTQLDLCPPSNPFSGLYRVLTGRHPDAYLGVVSLVSVLAHMLPSLLVNVPYRVIDTYPFHQSCLWLVVAVVAGMVCTVLGSFASTSRGGKGKRVTGGKTVDS
ncbi:hypothetical protein LQW54_011319 [Pestalotiopsis sp. IQ-011]